MKAKEVKVLSGKRSGFYAKVAAFCPGCGAEIIIPVNRTNMQVLLSCLVECGGVKSLEEKGEKVK